MISKKDLKKLFNELLDEHDINATELYDDFILLIKFNWGGRKGTLIELDSLVADEVDSPIDLAVEFGDDTLVYYRLFKVFDANDIDINKESLQDVKEIVHKKRNIIKLMNRI